MIVAVDVDHRWRRVLARALRALDISAIFLVRGEFKRDHHGCLLSRNADNKQIMSIRTQKYIEALTAKTKPKTILVCMIYYPDTNNVPSWANSALKTLGYNRNPAKLQLLIRKLFEEATR